MSTLTSSNQTGFVKGRYICENTRRVYDIMKSTEENNLPSLIVLIDFEKAFDTISINFIEQVINYFNFGPMFQRWITLFLHDTNIFIQLNVCFYQTLSQLVVGVDRYIQFHHIYLSYVQKY